MDQFQMYDTVRYTGPFNRQLFLPTGETGTIIEDYGDGNAEVEFSFPDGTTWLQCALPFTALAPVRADGAVPGIVLSRDVIFPAILGFERGQQGHFTYPPTGEPLLISRAKDRRIVVATAGLGTIIAVFRTAGDPSTPQA